MGPVLEIERCDLNLTTNRVNHHTELYPEERLVVRRGQPFCVTLCLKPGGDKFKPGRSSFSITVQTGPLPRKESDTEVNFDLSDGSVDGSGDSTWAASAVAGPSAADTVLLTLRPSADAPIGLYSLRLDQERGVKTSLGHFTVLFNPWCPRDAVYMNSESKRREYVLSQHGLIYRGTPKRIMALPWNYGQFEEGILDVCLKILDDNPKFVSDADQDCSARRNPVYVTRVLSAMINSQDDRGVLVGNWGEITDGVHPGEWVGSGDILRKWAQTGPVRYGQCWVFAAVACAVSRALGIPCRVVTNFGSAHDTDANLLIEKLYSEDLENLSDDSIWNFHVWVDSWMARPDLGKEYNGWQASDPTPQETSEGIFCCGPAPLKAIKQGELTKKYDAPFIFAEVNADVVEMIRLPNGKEVQISNSTKSVGQCISTKSVGSNQRHDITHKYKCAEGSEEERRVFEKAQHHNKLQQKGLEPGLHLKIKLVEGMVVGSDFEIVALLTNHCMDSRSCSLMIFAQSVSYKGKQGKSCGFSSQTVEVQPGEELRVPLELEYQSYGPALTPDRLIQVSALSVDKQSMDYCKAQKTIVLDEPDMDIQVLGEMHVNSSVQVDLTLSNPLPEALHKCSFTAEGAGLTGTQPIVVKVGDVGPKGEARAHMELSPTAAGSTVLLVNFDSKELRNIKSFIHVDVKKAQTTANI
ncbi:protein-glutamine gamma-glutamyltransferase 2-like [Eucyclogobius newberryi]|uniref:protein-glutamine gamma-glutamyltransferase 2-like n=1 Tax=Eucyclogobius newberryi TaxID=166745 RepID=UPI003B590497